MITCLNPAGSQSVFITPLLLSVLVQGAETLPRSRDRTPGQRKGDFGRVLNEEEAPLALEQHRFRWIFHVCSSFSGDSLL